ncbi:hypothetical protein MNBD_GAMMA21-358 [hydrothermal vent metagenome]|uniref:Thioredoxin domain-containing protein n=1 Tax=hydrothermal vent metagenome TaxID=652676 RepID=A0A3B0ZD67_9ZZZZ
MIARFNLIIVFCLVSVFAMAGEIQFTAKDVDGKQYKLSDYKGKWVVVNYWATWCPPCLDEIPELIEFHEQYNKDTAVVLGVSYEEVDVKYLKTFIDEYFMSYPVLIGDISRPPPFGPLIGLPTTYVISPEGKLVYTQVGGVTKAWLEDAIKLDTKRVNSK